MGLNGSCCASGGVVASAAGERMRAVARCQRTHVVGCAAVQVMAQFHVEPLPSPPTERAAGSASSGGGGGGGGGGVAVQRAGSRSVLDAVQDRFPHDDLHLQHTVRPPRSLSVHTHTHTHPFNGPFSGTTQLSKKVKFSHTRYRALGPELIPVYRQSARR